MRQTTFIKQQNVKKNWFLIDANNKILGKVATLAASHLRGKTKKNFTPNVDMGNNIIIVNAEKISLSSNKENNKIYYYHSGYPGGLKSVNVATLRIKKPKKILEKAIWGMLPHTKLGRKQFKNLYVYAGNEHKHNAQKPNKLEIE